MNILHSLDKFVWGLKPFGFHLSSLFLHLINVVLVYSLGRRVGLGYGPSAILAALWGLHPVNASAVGLIGSKADVFTATMLLVALLSFAYGAQRKEHRLSLWAFSCTAYALGLFTKELAFIYPVMLLFYIPGRGWPSHNHKRAWVKYLIIVWLITTVIGVLRLTVTPPEIYHSSVERAERLLTFGVVYLEYLWMLVGP